MPTLLVIEHLHVVEQGPLGAGVALEALAPFAPDRPEPALYHGLFVAIAPPIHRADDSMPVEARTVVLAGLGTALIRVMQ